MSRETAETPNDRYERLAAAFYAETGMMAPGKDDPTGHHEPIERTTAWLNWLGKRPIVPLGAASE